MKTLGNILWYFPFFGFINAIIVWILALLFALTIVGLPIAKGLFEFGKFLFLPFGNEMVKASVVNDKSGASVWGIWSTILSIAWIILFGWWLAILSIFQIVGLFFSIIGIPVAIVMAKSLGVYLNPVGKVCIPACVKEEKEKKAMCAKYNV